MSDASSDSSSITSFGDISVCEEIGELINNCHTLYEHIQTSIDTLDNIEYLIATQSNIQITHNGLTSDFDELLEKLHTEALENINANQPNNFGQKLLDSLNNTEFV